MSAVRLRDTIIDPRHSFIVKAFNQTTGKPSVITPLYQSRRSIGSRIGFGMVVAVFGALVMAGLWL